MTLLTLEVLRCTEGTYNSPSRVSTVKAALTGVAITVAYGLKQTMPSQCPD